VIGVLGYIAILILWFVNRQIGGSYRLEQLMRAAALLGVVFSTYLTFLEPFVIGATCLWCLMSAIIMLLCCCGCCCRKASRRRCRHALLPPDGNRPKQKG